jgi:hypothetical protein
MTPAKQTTAPRRILPCSRHNIKLVPSRASVTTSTLIDLIALREDRSLFDPGRKNLSAAGPFCGEALRAMA